MLKYLVFVLLLIPGELYAQACTNPGTGNVCGPLIKNTAQVAKMGSGAPADGSWAVLNHAADINSGDSGCYYQGQVTFVPNATTVTMTSGTYTCGASNITPISQRYLTGSMVFNNLSYAPSQTSSGSVTFEIKAKLARGWPSIWLLGGSGNTTLAPGCQYTSINLSWDNIGKCNWPSDASDSAEIDIVEMTEATGYTRPLQNVYSSGASNGVSQNISDATANFHLYHLDWSASQECWAIDGMSSGCVSNPVPRNPMFLIIENRVNPNGAPTSFPQVMTIQYVQVCDGTSCTAPDSAAGNTLFYDSFATSGSSASKCDLNGDGVIDSIDVAIAKQQALAQASCGSADLDQNGACNVVDVQRVINSSLGEACRVGP